MTRVPSKQNSGGEECAYVGKVAASGSRSTAPLPSTISDEGEYAWMLLVESSQLVSAELIEYSTGEPIESAFTFDPDTALNLFEVRINQSLVEESAALAITSEGQWSIAIYVCS